MNDYFKKISENCKIIVGDSNKEIDNLKDESIKLIYGSPPYPNAKRNYKTWKIENYIEEISPLIEKSIPKLTKDGFIVINVKANRIKPKNRDFSSERSLVVEELMIHMKKNLNLFCVDIEIWLKSNPVPTGMKVACNDAYEYNLWFSKSPKWKLNTDAIRRQYAKASLHTYEMSTFKPRKNGLMYISREKKIDKNDKGAYPSNISLTEIANLWYASLPADFKKNAPVDIKNFFLNMENNFVYGAVSGKKIQHQAVQPEYIPEKYILACTNEGDVVLDPWMGSGTTSIVALRHNRKFIGMEISEEFAELARNNISNSLKGKKEI